MKRSIQKRTKKDSIAFAIALVIFLAYAFTLLYGFAWVVINSFKTEAEYFVNKVSFPTKFTFSNYITAFSALETKGKGFFSMFFNSFWYSFLGTAISVFVSSMSAYVVAKYKFIGRKLFYTIALVIMMLPIVGSLPSQYEIYSKLGIINSPAYLVVFANGMGFNFLVLYGFFTSLPWDYVEAAFIDGCGHFGTFFRIMLPQAIGVMMSLYIVAFIGNWNDYMNPILFLESFPTLSSGIYSYQNNTLQKSVNFPMLFAGIIMSVVPVLTLFILFQDKIMNISLGGGIKG